MELNKWAVLGGAGALLVCYNLAQPGIMALRNNDQYRPGTKVREAYGPSLDWLDRLAKASENKDDNRVKLDFSVMSSLMVAGLASGFKSQVANLLWMKSDEYWHQGLFTRQVPLMEAVVTLDPQFIDAWSTAGWHWAYNIYADIPMNPDYKKRGEQVIVAAQQDAIETGLDYLKRGSNMNPDKYRLWFEWGWTRAEKAGLYDDETLNLYRTARSKSDAREIEITGPDGKPRKEQGLDILGRTIAHLLESLPEFDKALSQYADDLMKATPAQRAALDKAGAAWGRYGSDYPAIVDVYNANKADPVIVAQIKRAIPDLEDVLEGHAMRQTIAAQPGKDQPVGAYVSITARYMPAWKIMKTGQYEKAKETIVGVMNANTQYHLQGLDGLAKIYEIRGDTPAAIKTQIENAKRIERESTQEIGLHFLATLYERAAQNAKARGNLAREEAYKNLAYETWYRARERNALNFYALRNTRLYEAKYRFEAPEKIIKQIKESRKGGVPSAAPKLPPNVEGYYR